MEHPAWAAFDTTATARGDATAILHGAARISFTQLHTQACNWSASLPVTPGDRAVLCGENSIPLVAATLGIWRAGGIPVWVNADAPPTHLARAIEQTEATCVISDNAEVTSDCLVFTAPTATAAKPPDNTPENAIGSIVYTSGSTGLPKGVVQQATTLIDGATRVAQALGYTVTDRILCPVPFAFDYGWGQLLSMAFRGIPLVLPAPRNAFGICAAITDHRPTIFAGVPAVFTNLLSGLSPIRDVDRDSIRLITNTGSRIPDSVFDTLSEVFPDAAISLNYGLTETYRSASLPTGLAQSKPHSVGAALSGADIAVLRPDNTPCDPGETGQILHRGAGSFVGYWNDLARTAEVLIPDPLAPGAMAVRTGDLGYIDDNGHLTIIGRQDRQIKSMGVRVSPDEIEGILLETGLMAELAITSRPDDMLGEMVVACVVPHAGDDTTAMLKSLKREARARLSPFMTPRLYPLFDTLPRNPNGKVDYPALKRLITEDAP